MIAVVTFTTPGPLVIGLALSGGRWTWQGQTTGWWGTDGATECAAPATYRLNGRVVAIGPCTGVLADPSTVTIDLIVGQRLDLHTVLFATNGGYPLPWSSAPRVLAIEDTRDAATATYRALSPGTATLTTFGNCLRLKTPTATGQESIVPCPLVNIRVNGGA